MRSREKVPFRQKAVDTLGAAIVLGFSIARLHPEYYFYGEGDIQLLGQDTYADFYGACDTSKVNLSQFQDNDYGVNVNGRLLVARPHSEAIAQQKKATGKNDAGITFKNAPAAIEIPGINPVSMRVHIGSVNNNQIVQETEGTLHCFVEVPRDIYFRLQIAQKALLSPSRLETP